MTKVTLFPEVLSVTRDIDLFNQCNYKWFVYRCQRYTKYVANNDLEAGREFAKSMEITRNAYYKHGLSEAEAIALGVKNLLEGEFAENYANQDYKDQLKTPEKIAEVFQQMFVEHSMSTAAIVPFELPDGSLSVEQELLVELPFTHPETGKPLVLKCILDMLGLKDGVVFNVDEKTCKSVLTDEIQQADMLRSQSQFVLGVCLANHNKDKFGDLNITHVRINKAKIKKNYAKGEEVVAPYEFVIDGWFQKTFWDNLMYLVRNMLEKYALYKADENSNAVVFPRAYGNACTAFFKPCSLTYHCTSGNAQDLTVFGWKQMVCDSRTDYKEVPLVQYKATLLGE
jgi:hypothetical protein